LKPINDNSYFLSGAYVEITSRCNLRCLHCYNESGDLKSELSVENMRNILDSIPAPQESTITFSGGEPLLHPEFWKFVSMAVKRKFKKILVITNATLVTDEIAQKLAENKCSVQVSLNGREDVQHDRLCGKGNFQKTLTGIRRLLKYENEVIIRCTVSRYTKDDLIECTKYFVGLGIKNVTFGILRESGREVKNKEVLSVDSKELVRIVGEFNSSAEIQGLIESGIKIGMPDPISMGCPFVFHSDKPIPVSPRIDSSGDVYICQAFSNPLYSIGNVKSDTLSRIIDSEQFYGLLNFFCCGLNYMHKCQKCFWNSSCGRGCIAINLDSGSIQETDGMCELRCEAMENQLFSN